MRKALTACVAVAAFFWFSGVTSAQSRKPVFPNGSFCDDVNSGLCTELVHSKTYEGKYSGHDGALSAFLFPHPGVGQ